MMKAGVLASFLAALALAVSPARATDIGDFAPALKISNWVKGDKVNLKEGRGKYIYVVEFWATWCGPCRASIPHLSELQQAYKDKGVIIIGVSSETDLSKVNDFVKEQGSAMDYVVALDKNRGTWNAYAGAFGVNTIPHAFIVDRKGKLAWHGSPFDGMDDQIEKLVRKQPFKKDNKELAKARKLRSKYYKAVSASESPAQSKDLAKLGDSIIKEGKNDAAFLADFAKKILVSKRVKSRDTKLALKAAKLAYELSEGEESDITAVYARALFESGDARLAARYQEEAIEVCDDEDKELGLEKDLQRYKKAAAKKT